MSYGIERLQQLGYKVETVEGTAEALVAADFDTPATSFLLARERDIHRRAPLRSSFAPISPVSGKFRGKATVSTEIRGSGTDGTAPDWYALARAAGATVSTDVLTFHAAVTSSAVVGTSITLRSRDSVHERTISGCRGSFKIASEGVGMPLKGDFEGFGNYSEAAQTGMVPAVSFAAGAPATLMGSALTIGGTAVEYRSIEFAVENEVTSIEDGAQADGYGRHLIIGSSLTLTTDIWIPASGGLDLWTLSGSQASQAVSWTFGSGTGTTFVLAGNATIVEVPDKTYNDGIMSVPVKLEFFGLTDSGTVTITQS